jgi:predicted NBD/HSP70 family sugar kinase
MVELRVVVSDELAEHLAERARQEHTTPERLATQAVESLLALADAPEHGQPRFIALGRSGRSDVSERAEEILRASFGA